MEVTRWVRSTFRYVFQYKNRIALASIFAIVLAIVVAYYENWDPWTIFGFDRRKNNRVCSDPQTQSNSMPTKFRTSAVNGSRSRILLRIRRQYDNSCHHFIPTLRRKILDTVDISATVRKLKELRATAGINISGSAEQELWDEIKISSLSLFFVAIYMVSALCTLLRVQLHVLARTLIHMEQQDSRLHAQEEDFGLDSQV